MAHPIVTQINLPPAVTNGIAQAQALLAPGFGATLNGSLVTAGVANLVVPRRVIITSAGNDSGITFTITGTSRSEMGNVVFSETITGANAGAAASTQDFLTVTRVVSSAATASTIQVGTNTTASGPWVPWDSYRTPFSVSVMGNVISGSPTWGVEVTYDDVYGTWRPASVPFPRPVTLASVTGQTGDKDGSIAIPVRASRLTLTAIGNVQLTQLQAQG